MPALGPSDLLDFVLRALRAFRPCDPHNGAFIGLCVSLWIVCFLDSLFLCRYGVGITYSRTRKSSIFFKITKHMKYLLS